MLWKVAWSQSQLGALINWPQGAGHGDHHDKQVAQVPLQAVATAAGRAFGRQPPLISPLVLASAAESCLPRHHELPSVTHDQQLIRVKSIKAGPCLPDAGWL